MTVDDRKRRVLEAIVALYGMDGEPVGSSLLSEYLDMAVSSATLRNEMAALTKLGLLAQPHTSAGRVPSPQGYRYYVDHFCRISPHWMPKAAAWWIPFFIIWISSPKSWRKALPEPWPM